MVATSLSGSGRQPLRAPKGSRVSSRSGAWRKGKGRGGTGRGGEGRGGEGRGEGGRGGEGRGGDTSIDLQIIGTFPPRRMSLSSSVGVFVCIIRACNATGLAMNSAQYIRLPIIEKYWSIMQ
jgi:hypothetical protein